MTVEKQLLKYKWPVRKSTNPGTPPYGYSASKDRKKWTPIPEELDALELAKILLANGLATRECTTWLSSYTGKKISHQGFLKRTKADNLLFKTWKADTFSKWMSSSNDYGDGSLRYPEANKKATPQKSGRSRKSLLLKGKSPEEKVIIKKVHQITEAKKIQSRNTNQLRELLDTDPSEVVVNLIPEVIQEAIKDTLPEENFEQEVIFKPHPGPQTDFLGSIEDVIFYGGAKGGGKSYALIADPVRYFGHPSFRALILRRTMPELRDMIRHTEQMYPRAWPGAKYLKTEKTWVFPSGATLEFGYCETEDDAERYRGQSFHWAGIDELPQYAHRGPFDAIMSCIRSADTSLPTQLRCTGNPGNIGSQWVKEEFIDPSATNTTFWKTAEITDPRNGSKRIVKKSFKYIPATVYDNPSLMQDDSYLASLALLPEIKRKQMLEGNWDIIEDGAFPEFDRTIHVVPKFEIPSNWLVFRAADWGFSSPFALYHIAVDFDENMYVFREWYDQGVYDDEWAEEIARIEREEKIYCSHGVIDGSITTSRGARAEDSFQVINKILKKNRLAPFKKADRSAGSRKEGKLAVHRMLAKKETGRKFENGERETAPSLFIIDTCVNLIRTLPMLQVDTIDPEKVSKKNSEDHCYDALQYGIRSYRSNTNRKFANLADIKTSQPQPADAVFGY
tara:strand:- start:31 stop:2061 length:2031 start_codon:yes stop_codon:yes gene_type:complete